MPPDRIHPFDLAIQRILVDLETRLPPWMKLVNSSPSDPAFKRLSHELIALTDLVSPTSKEQLVRKNIVDRLESQARKIWSSAIVIPVGSYAQNIDMDLFVSVLDLPESAENLEFLYQSIEKSTLASVGTLTIVRGARIPIIKYIDSGGSGIQVDISMNNGSATASTTFIQHHLSLFPPLRPLTMVLKQWLFQRKMNEVYTRGGLSSYALFLLVLAIVHRHRFERIYPAEELVGRYLFQFLDQWSEPTAFSEIIRPLKSSLEKSDIHCGELYHPFSLCMDVFDLLIVGIQDPVNEQNYIGNQTFSIREIQQEWRLSMNALTVAIEEYTNDINNGRKSSLLGSIVGLTTREYESRKQINACTISTSEVVPQNTIQSISTIALPPLQKQISPPLDLHPVPAKRIKFRNMLTRGGGLIENVEVKPNFRTKEGEQPELLDLSADLTTESIDPLSVCQPTSTACKLAGNMLDFSGSFSETLAAEPPLLHLESWDLKSTTRPLTECAPSPLSPIAQSNRTIPSTPPSPLFTSDSSTFTPVKPCTSSSQHSVVSLPISISSASAAVAPALSLINLEEKEQTITSALDDLASLSQGKLSLTLDDLAGLDFDDLENHSSIDRMDSDMNSDSSPVPQEAIVFQGRFSRNSNQSTLPKGRSSPFDPIIAERAFGKFSLGIKS